MRTITEVNEWLDALPEPLRVEASIMAKDMADEIRVQYSNMSMESEIIFLATWIAKAQTMDHFCSDVQTAMREHQGMVGEAETLFDLTNGRSCGDE